MEILRLNLSSPLYYTPAPNADPFASADERGAASERLFCFELDETQYLNIEPDRNTLLGTLIFSGQATNVRGAGGRMTDIQGTGAKKADAIASVPGLPAGNYLFAQERKLLKKDDIITMAIEIQMEGLWQRLRLEDKLYLRYLFEDNSDVTQLFRPCSGKPNV